MFRNILEDALLNKEKKNNAGAKTFDVVMMFKILILQRFYGLGDTQIEYQIIDRTSFKRYRNKPLTEEQKEKNKEKSKTRARVEHVFGFMKQSMNGLALKSVGITRASGIIGLINLTYNLFRYEQVIRLNTIKIHN